MRDDQKEALYEQYWRGLCSGSRQRYVNDTATADDDESRHDGRQYDADDSSSDDVFRWWQDVSNPDAGSVYPQGPNHLPMTKDGANCEAPCFTGRT